MCDTPEPKLIEYNTYKIVPHRVSDAQFTYGGFGWAFIVHRDGEQVFSFTVKSKYGRDYSGEVTQVYKWSLQQIRLLLDREIEFENEYCYWFDINTQEYESANCTELRRIPIE